MKITILLMFISILSVSAGSYAQKITLKATNVSLEQALNIIRIQSGYDLVGSTRLIKSGTPLSVDLREASLEEALKVCFESQELDYEIEGKTILIFKKKKSIIEQIVDRFQQITVTGKVVDHNGQPLYGANVKVKGSSTLTNTNYLGEFILKGVSEGAMIEISFVGFLTQQLNAKPNLGTINMVVMSSQLKEISINAGYYSTTELMRTGSIAKVTAEEIGNQPLTSPLLALQGRVAGLEISPQAGSPGSAPKIRIRGTNSLRNQAGDANSNGNYPLYIIDGIPVNSTFISTQGQLGGIGFDPISTLDPGNIESIEVLKDADATAIYGSRGANGIILITTKKGSASAKTAFDFNIYRGAGHIGKKVDLLNTEQYLMMRKEAFANDNQTPQSFHYDLTKWDQNRYTDWQEELLGGSSSITNLQANISGGNSNTSFRLGGSIFKETLIFPGDFGYLRGTGNLNLNHVSRNEKFRASVSMSYGTDKKNLINGESIVVNALSLAPNAPALYNAAGELNWEQDTQGFGSSTWSNPLAQLEKTVDAKLSTFNASGNLSYLITPGLTLKTSLGFTDLDGNEVSKNPISANLPEYRPFTTGSGYFSSTRRQSWSIEPQISYDRNFQNHWFNILIGTTFQEGITEQKSTFAGGYTSDLLLNTLRGSAFQMLIADDFLQYRYTAVFGRIGYNYKQKYILNLTGRRDGSSRFGPGKQFGNFGAIGAAYVFSNEDYVKNNLSFLSLGKLRASYGVTGNDQISDYRFYNTYDIANVNYDNVVSLVPTSLFNPDYQWEVTKKLEIALQLGFVNDRIVAEWARYHNRSSNQLVTFQLPALTGFDGVLRNMPATIENSGWEFLLHTKNINSKNLQWNSSFNFSVNRNKLAAYAGIEESPYAKLYKIGQPLSIQLLYNWTGVDPATGAHTVQDVNEDGFINQTDDLQLLAPNDRKFYGGLNNMIRYKNVELSFLMQFSSQNRGKLIYNMPGSAYNQPVHVLTRWQKPGDMTDVQRFSQSNAMTSKMNTAQMSNYNSEDASFVRLKTLSLSYQLPQTLLQKVKIGQASVYIQGINLLTFTKYKGLDPETGYALPQLRTLTLGVNVKL